MKKLLALVLILVLAFSLTGCLSVTVNKQVEGRGRIRVVEMDTSQVKSADSTVNSLLKSGENSEDFNNYYPKGTVMTLKAEPETGWLFYKWVGDLKGRKNPQTFVVDERKQIKAIFLNYNQVFSVKLEQMRELINSGVDVDHKAKIQVGGYDYKEISLLMGVSAYNKDPEVVKYLIEEGANVNAEDYMGNTPLIYATEYNEDPKVIKYLVKAGAKVNQMGSTAISSSSLTPLMFAAKYNRNPEVINALLNLGANPTIRPHVGSMFEPTAFDYLKENDNIKKDTKVYKKLKEADRYAKYFDQICAQGTPKEIKRGIEIGVNASDSSGGENSFLAYAAKSNNNPEAIEILIEAGANINDRGREGKTALMYAAEFNKNPEIIKLLLNKGANPKLKDSYGSTALDYAEGNLSLKGTKAYDQLKEATE